MAETDTVTVSERLGGTYTNDVKTTRHHLYTDEPAALGGSDLGPTPFEYLAAALGGCTTITLRMYANRKDWPVEHLSVDVTTHKEEGRNVFTRALTITGDLDETQKSRMLEIADKCPVHKALAHEADIRTALTTSS
ncbi:MAG: OsmC family protein [Maricaulaceae bacterium]